MKIAQSDRINRPPADVFRVLADMSVFTKWNPSAERVDVLTPGPIRLGSRMRIRVKGFGDMPFEVMTFEPDRRLTVAADSPRMAVEHSYLLSREAGGTRLDQEATMRPKGAFKLMAPLMALMARKGARQTTLGLIRYVEARAVAGAEPTP